MPEALIIGVVMSLFAVIAALGIVVAITRVNEPKQHDEDCETVQMVPNANYELTLLDVDMSAEPDEDPEKMPIPAWQ